MNKKPKWKRIQKEKQNKFIGGEISTPDEYRECMKILSPEQQPKHMKSANQNSNENVIS